MNIFSRVEVSDIESKETISLTPGRISQTKMQMQSSYKKPMADVIPEDQTPTQVDNIKTELSHNKMDESDILIEERKHKTEAVTPDSVQVHPLINQKMEIEIVS